MAKASVKGPVDIRPIQPEDIESCIALMGKSAPDSTVPDFGVPGQSTYVFKDRSDGRVVGFVHLANVTEVRAMITDPDYELRQPALTVGFFGMEMFLAAMGIKDYYITVPEKHKHVQRFYEEDGAERVDVNTIRFRKRL